MLRKKVLYFPLILALLLSISLMLGGCGKAADEFKLGTGGEGGTYFLCGQEIAGLMEGKMGNSALVTESTAGSAANLRLMHSNLLDMAIVQNDFLEDAHASRGAFRDEEPMTDVRAVAGLYTEAVQIVVRKDAGIETVDDMLGKRISVGEKESGVIRNAEEVLQAYGLSFDDIEVSNLSYQESADALENGEIDAFFCIAGYPTTVITELFENADVKLIGIDERAQNHILNLFDGYSEASLPAGTYKGQDEDVQTFGVKAVLVADESMSPDMVAAVLDELYENREALQEATGLGECFNLDFASEDIRVPFHSGAANFFADHGIELEEKSVPVEESTGARVLSLDMYQTLAVAVLALIIGEMLKKRIKFLRTFCIPSPVIGGLIFAIISCILYSTGVLEFSFDETLRTVCMVVFFTSVGFQANMKVLKTGGKDLGIFLFFVVILIGLQNLLAVGLSNVLNVSPLIGLCTGSIPMVGGHGTAGAFGPLLEDMNLASATTLSTAAATFGLICGSIMGGPVARKLITSKNLMDGEAVAEEKKEKQEAEETKISPADYAPAAYELAIAMGLGTGLSALLSKTGMTFPIYIGAMIIAAIMRNLSEYKGWFDVHIDAINELGGICLSLFLGIAMITLKLWQLASLALPLIILLLGQTILMFFYSRFVIFNVMGRDYDAAVLAAGTCGFGMGATPNAMANMQAVTEEYRPSVKAYLLVPLVGSMFADFFNSIIITFFINLLS